MTTADPAETAQNFLQGLLTAWAADPDGPDARLRAALLSAALMGIASQRYLLQFPDLAAASDEDIVRIMAPVLAGLLGNP